MKQYIIIAEDGKDEQALERRMSARPQHFETARRLKQAEHFLIGGATLDEDGLMTGSVMIVQFENENALQHWLSQEPYVKEKVWKTIHVKPFRVADLGE